MKMVKLIVVILLFIVVVTVLFFMEFGEKRMELQLDPLEQRARQDPIYFPNIVQHLPQGFITLDMAKKEMDEVLRTFFWETNFVVQDSEGFIIFQTDVKDKNVIIIFQNDYYVNENRFNKIVDYAVGIFEQRNTIYNIGDVLEMRGGEDGYGLWGHKCYRLIITNVENTNTNGAMVYEIKFSIDPIVDEGSILGFFDCVVTNRGKKLSDFTLIDRETVRLELGRFERIDMLVLNIPEELKIFTEQDSMRRVRIHD